MENEKKRSNNWTQEEKDILKQLITESAIILENKENSTTLNLKKNKKWNEITNRVNNLTNRKWTVTQVKMAWKRMKLNAKANISRYRRLASETGGGEKPPSPTTEDELIMAIAPNDFIVESNPFDSDGVQTIEIIQIPDEEALPASSSINLDTNVALDPNKSEINHVADVSINNSAEKSTPLLRKNPKRTKNSTVCNERQKIVESNINLKKRNLEMLEELHVYNVKIAQLKIVKLELEIAKLREK